ncbi:MAG: HAD domain-containing protein [Bacteroidota bacterium]
MLIYLDIDGVMVPATIWKRPKILEDGFPEFSHKAVSALTKIISSLEADIVLTTSHKHTYSLSEWNKIFNRRNIYVNKITRLPENTNRLNRKDELVNWFSNRYTSGHFIIIDDDKSLNALPQKLKDRLIQTSGSVGLTDSLAEEAIRKIQLLEL